MIDFFKQHMGSISLSVVFLVVGLVLGFTMKEGNDGVYISANYPSGEKMFVLGKNSSTSISHLNLAELSNTDANALYSKISVLNSNDLLGEKLRQMAREGNGPFQSIPVTINLHLTDEEKVSGPVAKACKNSPVFNNPLVAYQAKDSENKNIDIKGLLGLNVAWEHISDCDPNETGVYDVWASSDYIKSWVKSSEFSAQVITVKAKMIIGSIPA